MTKWMKMMTVMRVVTQTLNRSLIQRRHLYQPTTWRTNRITGEQTQSIHFCVKTINKGRSISSQSEFHCSSYMQKTPIKLQVALLGRQKTGRNSYRSIIGPRLRVLMLGMRSYKRCTYINRWMQLLSLTYRILTLKEQLQPFSQLLSSGNPFLISPLSCYLHTDLHCIVLHTMVLTSARF